ncbi:vanadium-dependent haloperoxidase [Cyanobium sp. T1G-Tous]|uniref:vanadium-dependent haloperoxidase n=1 Tax=Cyanobium sp. T1G-Tous TaxID=2823722 RepID=UPI0020CD70DB|nr:vanadium-dependent haloperoxidase [Cyanobium sp. T1G-Tous]MCP9802394.1 vanadium-dependent haloperoxidase [Cyanobium sp. T1G-Tous]
MGKPVLVRANPDAATLNTEARSTDGSTTLAFKLAGAATDAVESKSVLINGRFGPTIAARFYGLMGSALYESYQIFEDSFNSSLKKSSLTSLINSAERTAEAFLKGRSKEYKRDFINNVVLDSTVKAMRNEAPGAKAIFEDVASKNFRDLGAKANDLASKISQKVASAIAKSYKNDGASDTSNFLPTNSGPNDIESLDSWTPEFNVGDVPTSGLQQFLTPQWGEVSQILGKNELENLKADLKDPEPFLLIKDADVNLDKGKITVGDKTKKISKDLVGKWINPEFINQAERVVEASANLNPKQKLIAEFWEDGAGTGFPPGSWMEFGKYASEKFDNNLADDAKLFFGIGQSLLSASVAAWGLKTETDYTRPLTAIRELSRLGLLGEKDDITGQYVFDAYSRDAQKTKEINGKDWVTYQTPGSGYSPPFSEFVSGHSTFSSAAGKFIEEITGSEKFGASVKTTSLIEKNKNIPVRLKWDTWEDAWKESGISRIYGGIHFDDGNEQGLQLGQAIGSAVFKEVSSLWS